MPPSPLTLRNPSVRVAFFCCDLQTKFASRVPNFARCVFVANRFAQAHKVLAVGSSGAPSKFFVTEQYPQGLGTTVPDVAIPEGCTAIAKKSFSMVVPEIRHDPFFQPSNNSAPGDNLDEHQMSNGRGDGGVTTAAPRTDVAVVLFGIEAHVCILQTVADLVQMGIPVVLARDGIASQDELDAATALDAMRLWPNVTISTSESILFQIIGGMEHPQFKDMSKIVRNRFGSAPTQ